MASFKASTQKLASSVFDSRHASTFRVAQSMIATRYKNPRRTGNPTLPAFLRLRAFASDDGATPLDRLTTGNAAGWLAHATSYGITGDTTLLQEIADLGKNPVERATTLTRGLVNATNAAGLPLSTPFQAVELLYSAVEGDGIDVVELEPVDPFDDEMAREVELLRAIACGAMVDGTEVIKW